MFITMDRYEADLQMVKRGWECHVEGKGRRFKSAREAIETYRAEKPGATDQFLPEFVIAEEAGPIGTIRDGDSVVFANFRGDRAIEITRAFEEKEFWGMPRENYPSVRYAGLMQYDGDLKLPKKYLVAPPVIENTMGEYLARNGIAQLAISETQKYGHVTYFWNGNRSGKFDDKAETYIEIPSDLVPFEQRPWMKAAEITDAAIRELETGKYRQARINLANGDMVGHTGKLYPAILGVETVDLCLCRLLETIKKMKGIAIVTADHGNSDEMFMLKKGALERDKDGNPQPKTSHTLNPVPFIIYDPCGAGGYELIRDAKFGLGNIAATALNLMGYQTLEGFFESMIR
jgi:2,3-bisphosphoglycerate-independent phosphoglycerate mutase